MWSVLPKWIRTILIIISILTIIFWVLFGLFKILQFTRIILHSISDQNHWWFFIGTLVSIAIAVLIILEFCTNLKPFTNLYNELIRYWELFKNLFN